MIAIVAGSLVGRCSRLTDRQMLDEEVDRSRAECPCSRLTIWRVACSIQGFVAIVAGSLIDRCSMKRSIVVVLDALVAGSLCAEDRLFRLRSPISRAPTVSYDLGLLVAQFF